MKSFGRSRYALTLGAAAAFLAGCGGSQGTGPMSMGEMGSQAQGHKMSGSYNGDLLYVADESGNVSLSIFTYPEGQPYATISGLSSAWGTCSDTSGNVYVTLSTLVYEFAHGSTTPTRTIQVPTPAFPTSCSVDPTTGNLAVVNYAGPFIDIWQDAQGTPTPYNPPFQPWTIAYDNRGNLWLDGNDSNETLLLAELPKGASQFETITLDKPTHWAGSIQWDGKYVAVLTNDENKRIGRRQLIYRLKITGQKATVVSVIPLRRMEPGGFFWIEGSTLIGTVKHGEIGFWRYPQGRGMYKEITGLQAPWGITISVPPSHK